jgi:hypothetical protein
MTVRRVPGNHREIFQPAALDILNPALIAAISRSDADVATAA